MKLKDAIIKDDKTYGNAVFSLAMSEIIQNGIKTSVAIRLVPYTDELETTDGIDKSIIIPFNSDKEEDIQFIVLIKTAVEKYLEVKGL